MYTHYVVKYYFFNIIIVVILCSYSLADCRRREPRLRYTRVVTRRITMRTDVYL